MRWKANQKDYTKWRKKFVFIPTIVEEKWVWFEFIEKRIVRSGFEKGYEECRLRKILEGK